MTIRLAWIVAAIALPLLAGCQQRQASQKMQRELRMQEDRIYQLEDWIRQYNEQLNSCREENVSLRGNKPAPSVRTPPKPPVRVSPFGDSEPKIPGIPEVELPPEDSPPAELPLPKPAGNRGALRPAPANAPRQVRRGRPPTGTRNVAVNRRPAIPESLPENRSSAAAAIALASAVETHDYSNIRLSSYEAAKPQDTTLSGITLNRTLTAALNSDGQPGDEGLMLVVEPRNDAGELVPPAGELSISVIDPAATSEAEARVGRWNYSAEETARLYRRTTLGDGIQLKLLWQGPPPAHPHLHLYARLTTPDGRKLQTGRKIQITLLAQEKTPTEEPRKLEPEPAAAAPAVVPEAPQPAAPPAIETQTPDPFEILPVAAATAPAKAEVIGPPAPVARPALTRPAATVARTVIAAAPPPIRTDLPVRPQPRRHLPARPPAEEQVAIPLEPGTVVEPESPPPVAPSAPKPQWSPNRP